MLGQSASAAGAEDAVEDEVRTREFAQGIGTIGVGLGRREGDDLCPGSPCRGQPFVVSAVEEGDDRDGGTAPAQGRRGEEGISGVVAGPGEHTRVPVTCPRSDLTMAAALFASARAARAMSGMPTSSSGFSASLMVSLG